MDNQPAGTSYRHVPDLVVVSPVHPGAIYVERRVPHAQAPTNRAARDLGNGSAALKRIYEKKLGRQYRPMDRSESSALWPM
eukprot:1359421-Alexandrium_andersonii.AAC.1